MRTTMKLGATGFALAVAAGAAQAQPLQNLTPNVSIYGVVDSGVEHLTNVGAGRGSLTRVPGLTGSLPSRIGFRGAEALGGGLWSQFVLETGFAADNGSINQGGRVFGRQAFVGLSSSDWGTLSFGRQYDNFYLALVDAGVLGPNAYGISSLDSYVSTARFDNSIAYLGRFGSFGVGANYSVGRDAVPAASGTVCAGENAMDNQACRAWSMMAKYTTPTWGIASGFSRQHGAPGAAGGLSTSTRTDDRFTLNGYYKTTALKIATGLIRRDNDGSPLQRRSNLYWIEGSYALTPALSLQAMVGSLKYQNSVTGNQSRLYAIRGLYSLSARTAVYATFGRMSNHGTQNLSVSSAAPGGSPIAGTGQTGVMLGMRTTF